MANAPGNDVNMMPGFMLFGLTCFGMPYGAANAGWVEVERTPDSWSEIKPVAVVTKYAEPEYAS